MYSVHGRSAAIASASTEDPDFYFNFWNPHASQRINIRRILMIGQSGTFALGSTLALTRTTTSGTGATTITPGIQNHSRRGAAPPSGPTLRLADFAGTKPTEDSTTLRLSSFVGQAAQGGLAVWEFSSLWLPPGSGLAVMHIGGTAMLACDITVEWEEDG